MLALVTSRHKFEILNEMKKKSLSNREISVVYLLGLVQYMLQAQGEVMISES